MACHPDIQLTIESPMLSDVAASGASMTSMVLDVLDDVVKDVLLDDAVKVVRVGVSVVDAVNIVPFMPPKHCNRETSLWK